MPTGIMGARRLDDVPACFVRNNLVKELPLQAIAEKPVQKQMKNPAMQSLRPEIHGSSTIKIGDFSSPLMNTLKYLEEHSAWIAAEALGAEFRGKLHGALLHDVHSKQVGEACGLTCLQESCASDIGSTFLRT